MHLTDTAGFGQDIYKYKVDQKTYLPTTMSLTEKEIRCLDSEIEFVWASFASKIPLLALFWYELHGKGT